MLPADSTPPDRDLQIEILTRARRYLVSGWCRDSYSVDRAGKAVGFNSDDAVAWCIEGAIYRASYEVARVHILPEAQRHRIVLAILRILDNHAGPRLNDRPDITQARTLLILNTIIVAFPKYRMP